MKINEIFGHFWEKISYFYLKIDYKLTQILAKIELFFNEIHIKLTII